MEWDQFGAAYDFPRFGGDAQCYLIASAPRSGSHYLGHLLFGTGELGAPLEYFHPSHISTWKQKLASKTSGDLFRALLARRTSPSGWFGVKSHWPQFEAVRQDREIVELLDFRKYIRIARRDRLAQAISLVIARQSEAWISFHRPEHQPVYDFDAIRSAVAEIEQLDLHWTSFFASKSIQPIEILYEDLVDDPCRAVARISCEFGVSSRRAGGLEVSFPQQQRSELNIHWRSRFLSEQEPRHGAVM